MNAIGSEMIMKQSDPLQISSHYLNVSRHYALGRTPASAATVRQFLGPKSVRKVSIFSRFSFPLAPLRDWSVGLGWEERPREREAVHVGCLKLFHKLLNDFVEKIYNRLWILERKEKATFLFSLARVRSFFFSKY